MSESASSKTQLDKLGERLRDGTAVELDLRHLDEYRRSFRGAFAAVVSTLTGLFGSEATGRPAKTTSAIIEKLRRQKIRLTQIQDIAGVRLVVDSVTEQDRVVSALRQAFAVAHVDDRRLKPSHGYRAVHVIVVVQDRMVEIQVRTDEQHRWAEVSEKMADVIDPAIKYGGGTREARNLLASVAANVVRWEELEATHEKTLALAANCRAIATTIDDVDRRRTLELAAIEAENEVVRTRADLKASHQASFAETMALLNELRRREK